MAQHNSGSRRLFQNYAYRKSDTYIRGNVPWNSLGNGNREIRLQSGGTIQMLEELNKLMIQPEQWLEELPIAKDIYQSRNIDMNGIKLIQQDAFNSGVKAALAIQKLTPPSEHWKCTQEIEKLIFI